MVFVRCCTVLLLALAAWPAGAQSPPISRPQASTPLLIAPAAEQAVQLRHARIEGEVQAGVAQTRITLEFHNPNRRVLEGELQFPLADGQQITGFALDINGEMRDAVPVARTAAARCSRKSPAVVSIRACWNRPPATSSACASTRCRPVAVGVCSW